eukprot:5276278-Karenia_brevis.AAC.1
MSCQESFNIAWDDVSGEALDIREVRKARQVEAQYIKDMKVWRKIPRSLAVKNGWKIVGTRWIDVNKGDNKNPVYRSRLVGQEFKQHEEDGLFAATPPLEALRYLISDVATTDETSASGVEDKVIMINDVSRAFFEAPAKRM